MCKILHFHKGSGSLSEQILRAGLLETEEVGFCGGRGTCGRCRVRFLQEAPLPSFADRNIFSPDELRAGWRLACTANPMQDCRIEIAFVQSQNIPDIVTWSAAEKAKDSNTAQVLDATEQKRQADMPIVCAADIGTTTVVMQYTDKISGDILCTHTFLNPQRSFGTDVVSRICHAENGKADMLQEGLLRKLQKGLEEMRSYGEPEKIILSGNTTMGHLLMGYPVDTLGRYPFTPYSLAGQEFDLFGHPAVLLPGISAFIGADIVSGIYACGMAEQEEISLFVDLGTNGEIVVGNQEKLWCSAAAAGSSFEGDISAQAIGTDMVALAYEMLEKGIMDESGLMREPWFTEGWKKETVVIKQQDIRKLQMAKAAICAGVSVLLEKAQVWDKIAHVYLAGGFGYYLDEEKAIGIGLIPAVLRGKCIAVGNTSLAGASQYGRSSGAKEAFEHIIRISQPMNLAQQPEFEEKYIQAMNFEEIWK